LSQVIKTKRNHATAQRIAKGLGTTAVLTLVAAINTAYAQEAAKQDAVVVTGIRKGIEDAIVVKRDAGNIVEAISAEDIGKLPDNSIADAIARLPGVTAQRVNGRAQEINVRGMSGDFVGTLLNGREQVSTGDNRAVEFDQYPSELIATAVINKTQLADLIGQGLAGTIDLQTKRPLSFAKREVALSARLEKNSLGQLNPDVSPLGNRFYASYIDQFADRTIGLSLGFSHLDLRSQRQKWAAWGYPDDNGGVNAFNGGNKTLVLGGAEAKTYSGNNKRDSFMGSVEFKPSKSYSGLLDLYYSKFKEYEVDRGLVTGLAWSGASPSNVAVQNNTVTGATWTGVKPVIWGEIVTRDDTVSSIGFNNKFDFGGGWNLVADVNKQTAKRNERILESYAGTQGVTDTYSYTINQNTGVPNATLGLNYADPNIIKLIDSAGWSQDGYVKYLNVKDDLNALKVAASKDLDGAFSRIDFGVNFANRMKSKDVPESLIYLKNSPLNVPGSLALSPVSVNGQGLNTNVLAWNIQAAVDQYYTFLSKTHPDIYNKQWSVEEKITTPYIKGKWDYDYQGMTVKGDIGVQIVGANQTSTGFGVARSTCTPKDPANPGNNNLNCDVGERSITKSYTDVLPNFNLVLGFSGDQTIRLAAGRQIQRPRLDQLRATQEYSYDNGQSKFSGRGGNPDLEPFRAEAFDVSYEKYFGKKAYLSMTGFYKHLKSYIYEAPTDKDFTGFPFPATNPPVSNIGSFTQPKNGKGGSISGYELTVSMPLDMLWAPLNGFGIVATYAATESEIKPFGPGDKRPLTGLSKDVYSVTAYYEKNGFQARVAQRYRSDYLGEIQGTAADRDYVYIAGETVTDLQLSYEFQDGAAKGVTTYLQVNNLNNRPYKEYFDQPGRPVKQYTLNGRAFLMGVSYKF
jgi:iron complex outermembrane recepter protein